MNVTVQKRYTYYQPNQFMVNGEKLFITDGNAIALDNPDFSMHEFRSNLVARWEYHPGSVLYLVWSHQQSKTIKEYQPDMNNNFNSLFEIYPQDVFLVKLNYYFSL
jgi:hypothetical protein